MLYTSQASDESASFGMHTEMFYFCKREESKANNWKWFSFAIENPLNQYNYMCA